MADHTPVKKDLAGSDIAVTWTYNTEIEPNQPRMIDVLFRNGTSVAGVLYASVRKRRKRESCRQFKLAAEAL